MQVSLHVKQLMYQLLQKDPRKRLGACEGANEIKRHPFFRGVNWALVRCMVALIVMFFSFLTYFTSFFSFWFGETFNSNSSGTS